MIQRFARDESGMTMGLAVMMILLIGVMGAGLLTFVQNDLKSVLEANKGQRALNIADAGVQAAKAHLRVDSFRQHYDSDVGNDCTIIYNADNTEVLETGGPRVGGDNWSTATDIYLNENGLCEEPSTRVDDPDTPWPEDAGVTKDFAGGTFHVTIECYDQFGDDVLPLDPCVGGAGPAPEASTPANGENAKKFFKITSTGYDTTTGDGAIRKIEAIYTAAKRRYAPVAYWTPNNIKFAGRAVHVSRMSFFAGKDISGVASNNPGPTIADPRPQDFDAIYGDWNIPPYNTTPRLGPPNETTPIEDTGFAALRYVCGPIQLENCSEANRLPSNGHNDYDSLTNPTFVETPSADPQPTTEITFPFDPGDSLDDPWSIVDPDLTEEMRAAASEQGNYCVVGGANNPPQFDAGDCSIEGWTDEGSIYFVDAAGTDIQYNVPKNYPLTARGFIVVYNGNFDLNSNSQGFEGIVIVIGDGTTTGEYLQAGQAKLNGYVTASGNIDIRGDVDPDLTLNEIVDLNTFVDAKLWSWRELYQQ